MYVYMFFFPFLCSGIPDLDLAFSKMLIHVCFRDVLQPAVSQYVSGMIWLSASLCHLCTVCTVNVCHLQVLAMFKKTLR